MSAALRTDPLDTPAAAAASAAAHNAEEAWTAIYADAATFARQMAEKHEASVSSKALFFEIAEAMQGRFDVADPPHVLHSDMMEEGWRFSDPDRPLTWNEKLQASRAASAYVKAAAAGRAPRVGYSGE